MKLWLTFVLAGCVGFLPQGDGVARDGAGQRPNVVLILADDLGWGELGCYGQAKIRTPHLDQMAREGLRFTQFYAGNNVCAPSRCCLLTGLHSGHAFIRDNREVKPDGQLPLPAGTQTFAARLQAAGYRTTCIGKWGLGPPGSTGDPLKLGFDSFYGFNCQRHAHNHYPTYLLRNDRREPLDGRTYSHDLLEQEALAFLERSRADRRPFFLYLPVLIPHLALQVPEAELQVYRSLAPDPAYDGKKGYRPHATPRAAYAAMITRLDTTVGRLRAKLKELGLAEKTLVLFTSDNGATHDVGGADTGFFNSTGGLRGRKGSMCEGGLRVPLLAAWPGTVPVGKVFTEPCAAWDLYPTLLELAGLPSDVGLDGLSLAGLLRGTTAELPARFLYWESPGYGGQRAVRQGPWKLVQRDLVRGSPKTELYRLDQDPNETADQAAAMPAKMGELELLLRQAHRASPEFPLLPEERKAKP